MTPSLLLVQRKIGVVATRPIPAKDFVRAQSLTHCFSREQVDPASLAGTVIHAVESSADQRLFKHYLRETEIRLRPAGSLKEAIDMMKDGCDLLLVDMDGPSDEVAQQFTAMRENGLTVPVVIVSADPSLATSTMFKTFKPDALLIKPVEQMMLLRAMAEHLGPGIGGAIASSLPEDHPNRPLVDGVVAQLGEYSKKIEAAQHAGDVKGCRAACLQVRSNAMALGFESLATLANNAAITLGATMSVEESGQPVRALLSACSRARAA